MVLTLHHGATFAVSEPSGDIRPATEQGYYHLDTRFLSCRTLRLDGQPTLLQNASSPDWHEGFCFLTNPTLAHAARATLAVVVHRVVGEGLYEDIEVENFGDGAASFALGVELGADFAYILTVKQQAMAGVADWSPRVTVEQQSPERLRFALQGADQRHETLVWFDRPLDDFSDGRARFDVRLGRRERLHLRMVVSARLGEETTPAEPAVTGSGNGRRARRRKELDDATCSLESDHPVLTRAFAQATHDLASLRIKAEERSRGAPDGFAVAAGIPWYMDLFGRDSLIASYQTMFADSSLARGTLEALARLQGTKLDAASVEAPGKILHEYRRGPIPEAARKLIPKYPYYGTIDATPLFLVTISEYVRWSGDLDFARRHLDNVDRALEWMQRYGDRDGDGFLEYESTRGLVNQGWKDSSDSVRFRDGRVATAPIALVEVQGYQYQALVRAAELLEHLGRPGPARDLAERAAGLRKKIADAFWMEDRRFFAEALDGQKRKVDALTSNPAHLLWCDAVEAGQARSVGDALLSDELFSGYGVRTMGDREGGFNPMSYHNGSVWPHDCSLALAGLVQAGLHGRAAQLAAGMLDMLGCFEHQQPPEVFCGYRASRYPSPVQYLHANRPQAWASGSVFLLVRCIAGLGADALARRVWARPLTVPGLQRLVLRNIGLAGGRVGLEIDWRAGQPAVRFTGLPAGWQERAGKG